MTRRLILMRHAKSSWQSPELDDHDRPLNGRGEAAALALGDWLRAQDIRPDEVLCSTALRTRQTAERLALPAQPTLRRDLYHASAQSLLRALQGAQGRCVLLVGHNPGIGDLAQAIVQTPPQHPRFADYPTGATLVADVPVEDWANLRLGSAYPAAFAIPRDLPPALP